MRKSLMAGSILALTVAVAPACATKKFVRTEVGNVNSKVDTLAGTLEETQERTRRNEERIGVVDEKAEAAGRSATSARAAADAAANSAREVDGRVTTVNNRVNVVEAAARRLIYEVTLSEDQGNFKFGKTDLPDPAKARLDQVVADLKADPKTIFIEVEGHTDNVGTPDVNERIGLERAEAVKRYLYEQHQVPLHKINVISYGEDKPVAPNNTRDGRAQNRRVVVKILS
ncbi:MAG TPA: OmpA family protein [Vicinamibacterales bacterium]|nr:OmpA family protein [Vicinamibacterales bacterium]